MAKCPVCGMMIDENTAPMSEYQGKTYYFHMPEHKEMFDKDPEKYINREPSARGHNMSGEH